MNRHPLVVFAFFLALAALFRSDFPGLASGLEQGLARWTSWGVIVAAIALLVRPWSMPALIALCGIQLLDVLTKAPEVPNHWLLTACVTTGILGAVGQQTARQRTLPDHEALWQALVGPMRVGIATFYAFTGFWKLNDHFTDPAYSCAVEAVERFGEQIYRFPTGPLVQSGAIWTTLTLEVFGPAILLFASVRRVGLLGFVLFHAVLSLDYAQGFLNFSGVMFALLVFFLDPKAIRRGLEPLDPLILAGPWAATWTLAAVASVVAGMMLPDFAQQDVPELIRWRVFVFIYLPFTLSFFLSALREVPEPRSVLQASSRSMAWLVAALVLFNGLCPWLGVKDRNSWQMYSNLRLEPGASNHWLVPRSMDLLDLQSDTVKVHFVSDRYLYNAWTKKGVEVRWYMLRWHAWRNPDLTIGYLRDGNSHEAETVADDPLLTPPPWPVRKVSWFRPSGEAVAGQCQW